MKNKKKEAKFFCEFCGSEVPRKSKVCPNCGKFFASVKCPKCGRIGANEDFVNGCPTCGYAVNPDSIENNKKGNFFFNKSNQNKSNINYKNIQNDANFFNSKNKSNYSDSSLPVWIYIISVAVLLVVVAIFYGCLTR